MINIELNTTKISLDETKRSSNFIFGFVQHPEGVDENLLVDVGFMPSGYPEILADLLFQEQELLLKQAWDLLDDRDSVKTWEEWHRLTKVAERYSNRIDTLERLHMAFDWNNGENSNFDFLNFYPSNYYDPTDEPELLRDEIGKSSHLR